VTRDDAENFRRIAPYVAISIDGDTRFDRVQSRLREERTLGPVLEKLKNAFVVGSSWPDDEVHVLPCLPKLLQNKVPVVIAPHEPTQEHLEFLETQLAQLAVKSTRLSILESAAKPAALDTVILLDRMGILADVYRVAAVAYIGGSFRQGIHSVMEAAAHGCVCVFGPKHRGNREALALLAEGHAQSISNATELEAFLILQFAKLVVMCKIECVGIKKWVENRTGATNVVVDKLLDLLSRP
jgi:3-deoxy-D-manno-octulosonic-acid transferase